MEREKLKEKNKVYHFMILNDGTEISYSSPKVKAGKEIVEVYIKSQDQNCFKEAICILPDYKWESYGYSDTEMKEFRRLINSVGHLLIRFSRSGGIETI